MIKQRFSAFLPASDLIPRHALNLDRVSVCQRYVSCFSISHISFHAVWENNARAKKHFKRQQHSVVVAAKRSFNQP